MTNRHGIQCKNSTNGQPYWLYNITTDDPKWNVLHTKQHSMTVYYDGYIVGKLVYVTDWMYRQTDENFYLSQKGLSFLFNLVEVVNGHSLNNRLDVSLQSERFTLPQGLSTEETRKHIIASARQCGKIQSSALDSNNQPL